MKQQILVKKDNNGRLRTAIITLKEHAHIPDIWIIERSTGLLGGTMTEQPRLEITEGKASRTAYGQACLEYDSNLSDYLDKGYKLLKDYGYNTLAELTPKAVKEILLANQTDSKGVLKPMLAKTAFDKTDNRWNKVWYASAKIDGVRCLMFWNSEKQCIETASRGGKDYNNTVKHLLIDEKLIHFFKSSPEVILDGELYIHGRPLSYISGLCRANVNTSEAQKEISYYVFDVVSDKPFNVRKAYLDDIALYFAEVRNVVIVNHITIISYEEAWQLHDKSVGLGFEGIVLRDPDGKYGYGSRDWRMIKMKMFDDAEFKIVGFTPGLRDEDFVFVMEMENGITFEAKPAATRELREWYLANMSTLIGKFGTVKYFGFGANGRPNLPVFKCLRD